MYFCIAGLRNDRRKAALESYWRHTFLHLDHHLQMKLQDILRFSRFYILKKLPTSIMSKIYPH